MAQVRIANPAGYFNGATLVQYGTPGGTTLLQLIDGVSGATGDGQYEVNFVQNELTVYGSGVNGPNLHVVKLTSGIPSAYDPRVLKLHNFLVVNGSIAGNRELRVAGGVGNQNIVDGAIAATKLDPSTFQLQNLTDVSVVDSTTVDGQILTFHFATQKWIAASSINVSGGITTGSIITLSDNNSFTTPAGNSGGTSRISWGVLGTTTAVNQLYACNALGSGYMVIWKAGVAGAASGVPGQIVQMAYATGGTFASPSGTTICFAVDKAGNAGAVNSMCAQFFTVGTLATGPTITAGAGAPSSTQPNGSIYFNTTGGTGTRLYVSAGGGTWNAVAGV